jgi:hypothetical protein
VRKSSKIRIDPARRWAIIAAVKDDLDALAALDPDFDPMKAMFRDRREGGSMRLTKAGYGILKDKYPHWSVDITNTMTVANHTYLVSVSTFPYFLNDGVLTTFDPNLGVLMKLVSGDFAQLERLHPRT